MKGGNALYSILFTEEEEEEEEEVVNRVINIDRLLYRVCRHSLE